MCAATTRFSRRELAHRASSDVEVTLYWSPVDDSTSIEVWQLASNQRLSFAVAGEDALDAFHHPFAHVPQTLGETPRAREAGARS
jgi:hypothetical protein